MLRTASTAALIVLAAATAHAEERMRLWNLSGETLSEIYFAPPGTQQWGKNQCLNDKDKTVDNDERLRLTELQPGTYDVKVTDVKGRTCLIKNAKVEGGKPYAISIEHDQLTDCTKK